MINILKQFYLFFVYAVSSLIILLLPLALWKEGIIFHPIIMGWFVALYANTRSFKELKKYGDEFRK